MYLTKYISNSTETVHPTLIRLSAALLSFFIYLVMDFGTGKLFVNKLAACKTIFSGYETDSVSFISKG
jgi:hypothetical protein